jgi:hypothetical protein
MQLVPYTGILNQDLSPFPRGYQRPNLLSFSATCRENKRNQGNGFALRAAIANTFKGLGPELDVSCKHRWLLGARSVQG